MHRRTMAVIAAASATFLVAPSASAAPPAERETFELHCDGQDLLVAVNSGNGSFTPARVVGTRRMFVPIEFGDFYFTATSPSGEVLVEGGEPGETKGHVAMRSPRPTVTCSFEEVEVLTEDDPEFGLPAGTIITFGGDVTGFMTGR